MQKYKTAMQDFFFFILSYIWETVTSAAHFQLVSSFFSLVIIFMLSVF